LKPNYALAGKEIEDIIVSKFNKEIEGIERMPSDSQKMAINALSDSINYLPETLGLKFKHRLLKFHNNEVTDSQECNIF